VTAPGHAGHIQVYDVRQFLDIGSGFPAADNTFSRPVAVLLIAVLHFIPDAEDPYGIVRRLMEPLPSGSYRLRRHRAQAVMPT
jgi:hypothetical protein